MRSCRICLKTDVLDEMIACFENPDIIQDLYFLSNVAIVEIGETVKICRRCAKNIKQAADFKRICIDSDLQEKKNSNERFIWFSELQKLKASIASQNVGEKDAASKSIPTNLEQIVLEANSIMTEIDIFTSTLPQARTVQNDNTFNNAGISDFIEQLNFNQLKELSDDLLKVFESNDFDFNKFGNNSESATS